MNAMDLVGYVIASSEEQGRTVTNLRLQKLLYFIQKEHLIHFGVPAFGDDIYAWQYGPVIPAVYHKFSYYANTPIINAVYMDNFDNTLKDTIKDIVAKYINTPTWMLVQFTHQKNSPWSKAIAEKHDIIALSDIATLEN